MTPIHPPSDNFQPQLLHPDHLADLRRSGLSDETIERMGVRSADAAQLRRLLGRNDIPYATNALVIPYSHTAADAQYFRAKLFPAMPGADGHSIRYLQCKNSRLYAYRPPGVESALHNPYAHLFITEGEKKSCAATQAGLPCLGLGGLWSWVTRGTSAAIEDLVNLSWMRRPVTLVPDSDCWSRPDLLNAVYALGRDLAARGADVSVVMLPPGQLVLGGHGQLEPTKMGVDDFLVENGVEEFRALLSVKISDRKWASQREWYSVWLAGKKAETKSSRAIEFTDDEPWPEVVDGAALLDEIANTVSRYIVLPPGAATAIALFVLHTYALEAAEDAGILAFTSTTPRCGKTKAEEVLGALVYHPLTASHMSSAALFRILDAAQPTLLLDELDATFVADRGEDIRQLLNAGTRRGANVIRCVGDANEVQSFAVFGTKVLAGIKRLPATIEDRAINIRLKRKTKRETVARVRGARIVAALAPLRRKCVRWVLDNVAALKDAEPDMPEALHDRAQDAWRPLLAIANRAGGTWPTRAHDAAVVLAGTTVEDSIAVQLLGDIQGVFLERQTEVIESGVLIESLTKLEDRPWCEFGRTKKPMSANQLAAQLRHFDDGSGNPIRPQQIKVREGDASRNVRGYRRDWFKDVFERYLEDFKPLPPLQPLRHKDEPNFSGPLNQGIGSGSGNGTKPLGENDGSGGSGPESQKWVEEEF